MENRNDGLKKYLALWRLSEQKLIVTTPTSFIYEVSRDEKLILKIFTPIGAKDERASATLLAAWNGQGAVKLKESDPGALLMEKLEEPNLYYFSQQNKEKQATDIFIPIICKIHASPIPKDHDIPDLKSLFRPLESFRSYPAGKEHLFQKAVKLGKELLQTQTQLVLLHGDLHHENVMRRKDGDFVCFDPKGFIGDPCYEIATILKNPWDFPEISEQEDLCLERAKTFSETLNLSLERILAFAFVHMCLSTMWAIQEGDKFAHQLKIAEFLDPQTST